MTNLGSLGSATPDVDVSFDYFGHNIRASSTLGELDYLDFMEKAGAMDVEDVASIQVVKDFTRLCIEADDFELFWATAKQHRQGVEQLFDVLKAIVEATSDRPTVRPSSSSATPTSVATNSALPQRLEGRPDLQLLLVRQQEGRGEAAG